MTLNLSAPHVESELKPRIVVVGVGGAGTNGVNNMINANLEGVEFVVANTDAQSLSLSHAERRIQLGTNITHGLGAGARPDIGRAAAEEVLETIVDHLQGSHMAFITAGMGGGTGTGAAPVIARAAREHGILTVGVVTKPFQFEGSHRMTLAEEGIEELQHFVDTLIVIPNQNLFRVCNEKTTFADAFRMADNVLYSGVRGVTDLMVMPGLINLDFADIRTVMSEMGKAMMGTGEAGGERRSIEAAEAAIANPLLDDVSMKGAHGVLINITGGPDMTLFEVDEAANRIREEVDSNANIIFGSTFDEGLEGIMRVSIVATGIEAEGQSVMPRPGMISLVHDADRVKTATPAEPAPIPAAPVPTTASAATPTSEPAIAMPANPASADEPAMPLNLTGAPKASDTAVPSAPVMPTMSAPATASMTGGAGAAALAAEPADKPFIAPPPVMPAAEPLATPPAPAPRRQRPIPEATTAPAAKAEPEPEKRRGFNLFQRVTGAVTPRRHDVDADEPLLVTAPAEGLLDTPADGLVPEPAAPVTPAPKPAATTPEAAAPAATEEPAAAAPDSNGEDQGRLDVDSPTTPMHEDEDLLEIPAFLRRQANQ